MSMLPLASIKEQISSWISKLSRFPAFSACARKRKEFFYPLSSQKIRRLQFFWLGCGGLIILAFSYGISTFLFEKSPLPKQKEEVKVTPTSIETAPKKVNMEQAFRNKIEGALDHLSGQFADLKSLVLGKQNVPPSGGIGDDSLQEAKVDEIQSQAQPQTLSPDLSKDQLTQEDPSRGDHSRVDTSRGLQNKIARLEEQVAMNNGLLSQPQYPQGGQGEESREVHGNHIQKTSLGLTENSKPTLPKTVDTTIPAGAFAKTVLLSGLDASSAMTAASDPRPMLLRIIDSGTLPRRFQSDLKDCHCTASAYGDLSSERVYARLEKLTCVERKTGEVIETQVAGYVAGSDGKAGIRGVVASKDGQFLGRSLVGGIFAGLSNVANPQNRQAQVNPFMQGGNQISPPNIGDMFTAGMTSGVSTALDRLSQYYIDRAEQLQPVIQITAGQVADIVFTEGTFIGSQNVKENIASQKEEGVRTY